MGETTFGRNLEDRDQQVLTEVEEASCKDYKAGQDLPCFEFVLQEPQRKQNSPQESLQAESSRRKVV